MYCWPLQITFSCRNNLTCYFKIKIYASAIWKPNIYWQREKFPWTEVKIRGLPNKKRIYIHNSALVVFISYCLFSRAFHKWEIFRWGNWNEVFSSLNDKLEKCSHKKIVWCNWKLLSRLYCKVEVIKVSQQIFWLIKRGFCIVENIDG